MWVHLCQEPELPPEIQNQIYFIGFNHLLVLMLVTAIANISIGVEINCVDPKYFSSGILLL